MGLKLVWEKLLVIIYDSLTSFQKRKPISRADKLLFAAFMVAVLRQVGVNGHFIGFNPAEVWPWFQPVEALSGIAMAALEGIALAYVSKRWKNVNPIKSNEWTDWVYWLVLAFGQLLVVVSIITYIVLYGFAAQRGLFLWQIELNGVMLPIGWNVLFNITVASANVVIAVLIGIVDTGEEKNGTNVLSDEDEAWLSLIDYMQNHANRKVTPKDLADASGISIAICARVLKDAVAMGMARE